MGYKTKAPKQGVSVAILAGGQSRRMGQDKAFLEVGGQLVIERVLAAVQSLTDDLLIGTNAPDKYARFGVRMVSDIYPNKATLGGIYTVIEAARHSYILVVACDMPLLNQNLLQYLITLAPTAEVIAPLLEPPQPETTHTVYSKACLPSIHSRLLANNLRIINFFKEVSVRLVKRDEIAKFDPNFYSFINMNTPDDWQQVRRMVGDSS